MSGLNLRCIELAHFLDDDAERPPVDDDVVRRQYQRVLFFPRLKQAYPPERCGFQVETLPAFLFEPIVHAPLPILLIELREGGC